MNCHLKMLLLAGLYGKHIYGGTRKTLTKYIKIELYLLLRNSNYES